jgi:hypothetical protein
MSDGEDEADELPLVGGQGLVAWCHWSAEERHRVLTLEKDSPKPIGGGFTLHDEGLGEVRQREDRRCGDCCLEGGEGSAGRLCPGETLLLEQSGQQCCDGAKLLDELAVVPSQAEEEERLEADTRLSS